MPTGSVEQANVYAIIEDGTHQYKVEVGQTLDVQLHDLAEGQETVEFGNVLLIAGNGAEARVGQPFVPDAKVTATVLGEVKGDKIIIQKIRRRKHYRLKKGHRQHYLRVKIDKIET